MYLTKLILKHGFLYLLTIVLAVFIASFITIFIGQVFFIVFAFGLAFAIIYTIIPYAICLSLIKTKDLTQKKYYIYSGMFLPIGAYIWLIIKGNQHGIYIFFILLLVLAGATSGLVYYALDRKIVIKRTPK